MVDISAVIITFNEERNIARCIDSVRKVSNDIIVVDSFSTDDTKQICIDRGVRFVERCFDNYSNQKNFGASLAKYDHIISLDADEHLSDELLLSIEKIKKTWTNEAFRMNRMSTYGGKWIRHGCWYPDKQTRLWNRKFGKWGGNNPHEKIILNEGARVVQLKGDILHYSYLNSTEAIKKIQLYSDLFAKSNAGKRKISSTGIVIHAGFAFFKSLILKRGFLDGYVGLAVAVAVANHTYYKYAKLYEANLKLSSKGVSVKSPVKEEVYELSGNEI